MQDRAFTAEGVKKGLSNCNSWLEIYVHHQRHSESPKSFHFWTGVSTLAGALRRKVWIDQRHFQWTPNMYVVLVGPAGVVAKSTSIRPGLQMLEALEGINFGPQSMTWQALVMSFQKAQEGVQVDGAIESLPMACLTVGVSELGTFLDPTNRELIDLLTAMWDGQKEVWRRTTKGEGTVEITNPWINLIACTTPAWLKANFPEDLVGGGLTSRCIFVYEDKKYQLVPYPSEKIPTNDYADEELALIHDLRLIGQMQGPYRITNEALQWGDSWYRRYQNGGLPAHLANPRFEGYVARKQTHVHKLAIVLAASKRSELLIEKSDLVEAEGHISALEKDMLQVFQSIGVSQQAKVHSEVVTMIRNHPEGIEYVALWNICSRTMAHQDFKNSLVGALDAGQVKRTPIPGFDEKKNFKLSYVRR